MEVPVYQFTHEPNEVVAVKYGGKVEQARLLIADGFLEGADTGFGRGDEGPHILRGQVNGQAVFPGDVVALHPDWTLEVFEIAVFNKRYGNPHQIAVLTDGQEPESPENPIPTGHNPDAVNLENADAERVSKAEDERARQQSVDETVDDDDDAKDEDEEDEEEFDDEEEDEDDE